QKLPPEKRTLALSGGRSQYFVVEELKAFLPCAESQIPGLSVVATNAFIEPVGRTRYSATTLADSIVSLTGGQAIHPPVDNSRDVIRRYNAALAQPGVRLALIGAGGITDSFVANNAGTVVNHQGCQGDLAGIPVDNGFQPIHVQGLNDVYRQRLTLDQIRNWANGNLTKVWLLVTQEQKSQITDLVLRQQKRVVSRAYLSVELANQLLRSHSSGSGVPATSSPTQKPPQAARPRKSTNR
ncbi:MAG: hypothetical protein NT069_00135, partial [Planctomycetota bacterium]|nr:hypothetical protein [Planctomycetota bacterium]